MEVSPLLIQAKVVNLTKMVLWVVLLGIVVQKVVLEVEDQFMQVTGIGVVEVVVFPEVLEVLEVALPRVLMAVAVVHLMLEVINKATKTRKN